jgi:hypothetical protein
MMRSRWHATAAAAEMPALDLAPRCDGDVGCLTCGDVARRMRVLSVSATEGLALCLDEEERRRTVDTGIVGTVVPGEILLVHAGTALVRSAHED